MRGTIKLTYRDGKTETARLDTINWWTGEVWLRGKEPFTILVRRLSDVTAIREVTG